MKKKVKKKKHRAIMLQDGTRRKVNEARRKEKKGGERKKGKREGERADPMTSTYRHRSYCSSGYDSKYYQPRKVLQLINSFFSLTTPQGFRFVLWLGER